MPEEQTSPGNVIWANKLAISIGAVASFFVIIIPATVWFATLNSKLDQMGQQQQVMWNRLDVISQQRTEDATRLTRLETIIASINDQLGEIKASISKIETRVVR